MVLYYQGLADIVRTCLQSEQCEQRLEKNTYPWINNSIFFSKKIYTKIRFFAKQLSENKINMNNFWCNYIFLEIIRPSS